MKYNIQINQFILSKTKLDLKDCAILDYLKSFCGIDDKNVKQLEITENGVRYKYTWINFDHLIKEMPLLKLKGKASISERIHKIEKEGFIKTFIAPDRSLYVRLNEKIKEIDFTDDFTKGVRQDERRCSAGRTGCSAGRTGCSAGRTGGVRLDEQHKHNINSNIISESYVANATVALPFSPPPSSILTPSSLAEREYAFNHRQPAEQGIPRKPSKKPSYGNQTINCVMDYFKTMVVGGELDESEKSNRHFAYLSLNKLKKQYPDNDPVEMVEELIDIAVNDKFHSKNATSFKYLYYNMQRLIHIGTQRRAVVI